MRKPNFFIVGAPKCATTSMYEYLRQHPQVFMPNIKEPYFFCPDLDIAAYRTIRERQRYLALFAGAGEAKRIGEASVWYLYSREAARRIHAFSPSARILIMLRNPVDMMYSLHGQFLKTLNEEIVDFEQALGAQPARRRGRAVPPKAHFPQGLQYTDVARYTTQVKRYFDVFGRRQTQVISFDDFVRAPARVYRDVLRFLGVQDSFRPDFEVANAAEPIRIDPITRMLKDRPRLLTTVKRTLPDAWRRRVVGAVRARQAPLPRKPHLSPRLRARLQKQFRPEVEALSELLGRNLTVWCTPA